MNDLILLVADKNMQFALKGALQRFDSLQIRPINFEFLVHPGRDGGTRKTGPELLSLERGRFSHALIVLDFEGCGTQLANPLELEVDLDRRLSSHWNELAKSIVIAPELDTWIWGADNSIHTAINWPEATSVRDWLLNRGFEFEPNHKPKRPKEAFETILRVSGLPRSSAVYQKIASTISLRRCSDPAFIRLGEVLRRWFPIDPA